MNKTHAFRLGKNLSTDADLQARVAEYNANRAQVLPEELEAFLLEERDEDALTTSLAYPTVELLQLLCYFNGGISPRAALDAFMNGDRIYTHFKSYTLHYVGPQKVAEFLADQEAPEAPKATKVAAGFYELTVDGDEYAILQNSTSKQWALYLKREVHDLWLQTFPTLREAKEAALDRHNVIEEELEGLEVVRTHQGNAVPPVTKQLTTLTLSLIAIKWGISQREVLKKLKAGEVMDSAAWWYALVIAPGPQDGPQEPQDAAETARQLKLDAEYAQGISAHADALQATDELLTLADWATRPDPELNKLVKGHQAFTRDQRRGWDAQDVAWRSKALKDLQDSHNAIALQVAA